MRHSFRQFLRIWHIGVILKQYRLDELFNTMRLPGPVRWMRIFIPSGKDVSGLPRGERLRLALQELGPVYVKFGQILSTRKDLFSGEFSTELEKLQDRVPPFSSVESLRIIEDNIGLKIPEVFATFEQTPLASASLAQVHVATLHSGEEVAIKVIRPGVEKTIKKDLPRVNIIAKGIRPMATATNGLGINFQMIAMTKHNDRVSMICFFCQLVLFSFLCQFQAVAWQGICRRGRIHLCLYYLV